jgi:hypothetical protein
MWSRHTYKLKNTKAMDLAGDLSEDEDEAYTETEAGAEHNGMLKEPTLHNTHHPTTMEATHTKSHHNRTKATISKGPRAQDGKYEEDKGTTGGGVNEQTR